MQFESGVDSVVLGQVPSQIVQTLKHLLASARAVIGASVSAGPVPVRHMRGEGSLKLGLVVAQGTLERVVRMDAEMILEVVAVLERSVAFQTLVEKPEMPRWK